MIRLPLPPRIAGDLAGGFAAAVITLPQAIGYGIVAYAVLGPSFAATAILLGIYSAVIGGLLAALAGGTPNMISGPKAAQSLLIASLLAGVVAAPLPAGFEASRSALLVALASGMVLVSALVQLGLGGLRFGNAVKYVPQTVISGFMNGIAILLILSQWRAFFGVASGTPFIEVVAVPERIQLLSVLVGAITLASNYLAKRHLPKVPSVLVALVTGTAFYYLVTALRGVQPPGGLIGEFRFEWPNPTALAPLIDPALNLVAFVPTLLAAGVVLGLLSAMDSLLSSAALDNVTDRRHGSNRELVGQGLGNVACALIGALPCSGTLPRALASFRAGGRTRFAAVACALTVFLALAFAAPLIGRIPLAVIAGILISIGIGLFDDWAAALVVKLRAEVRQRRAMLTDLAVAVGVALVTVTTNLMVAVGIGVAVSAVLFISRTGKSLVRRTYDARSVRSRKVRNRSQAGVLAERGAEIRVFELQGPIFFGSADHLATEVERAMRDAQWCVLDMRRVTDIDSTGSKILLQLHRRLKSGGRSLLVSYLPRASTIHQFLEDTDVVRILGEQNFFPDTDTALEWAEDQTIFQHAPGSVGPAADIALSCAGIVSGMDEPEQGQLFKCLKHIRYLKGAHVFREGDLNHDMYVVVSGTVTIAKHLPGSARAKRLITFGHGSIFGEMALLDQKPRSADARAEEDTELLCLSFGDFQRLKRDHPQLIIKLLTNIGSEISHKLRSTSQALTVLEDA